MSHGFLLDEQLPKWWRKAIRLRQPQLDVWRVGGLRAPTLRSPDPIILHWCEANSAYLVTNNRASMPGHLAEFVQQGHHVPGIFIVDPNTNIDELADELSLITGASFPDEYRDQIRYLPLS